MKLFRNFYLQSETTCIEGLHGWQPEDDLYIELLSSPAESMFLCPPEEIPAFVLRLFCFTTEREKEFNVGWTSLAEPLAHKELTGASWINISSRYVINRVLHCLATKYPALLEHLMPPKLPEGNLICLDALASTWLPDQSFRAYKIFPIFGFGDGYNELILVEWKYMNSKCSNIPLFSATIHSWGIWPCWLVKDVVAHYAPKRPNVPSLSAEICVCKHCHCSGSQKKVTSLQS